MAANFLGPVNGKRTSKLNTAILLPVNWLISKDSDYSSFITIIIENFVDKTIPKWLTQKLISSKITPSNNILDFQNYILLETGYPLEVYDVNKIISNLKKNTPNSAEQNCQI